MEFRKAVPADIPDLCALRTLQLIDEGQNPRPDIRPHMEAYFQEVLTRDQLVEFLAVEGGQIAATGAVTFLPLPPSFSNPSGLTAYVTNMYTAPAFRGRGLASRMLGLLSEECRQRGVLRMLLAASNQGRGVYLRFGFQPADNWMELQLSHSPAPLPDQRGVPDATF